MRLHHFGILIFLLLRYTPSQALDLSKVNFSYQYDLRAPVQAAQRVVRLDEGITVFIKIDADSIHRRRCVFLIQDDYKSSKHDTLSNYAIDTLFMKHNQGYFKLTLPAINESIFILSVPGNNPGEFYLFETEVKSLIPFPTMYPVDENGLPIFTAYISNEKSKLVGSDKFHVYAYNENFSSADPPMGSMGAISPTLEIDSSFFIGSQLSGLDDFKFYLLQEDTLEQSALTLLKCPEYFPKLKTIPTLVEPLRYITTQSEIKSLTKNYTKKSFEVFWINTYGTKFRAKSAIKLFYDAVEETNLLFTD